MHFFFDIERFSIIKHNMFTTPGTPSDPLLPRNWGSCLGRKTWVGLALVGGGVATLCVSIFVVPSPSLLVTGGTSLCSGIVMLVVSFYEHHHVRKLSLQLRLPTPLPPHDELHSDDDESDRPHSDAHAKPPPQNNAENPMADRDDPHSDEESSDEPWRPVQNTDGQTQIDAAESERTEDPSQPLNAHSEPPPQNNAENAEENPMANQDPHSDEESSDEESSDEPLVPAQNPDGQTRIGAAGGERTEDPSQPLNAPSEPLPQNNTENPIANQDAHTDEEPHDEPFGPAQNPDGQEPQVNIVAQPEAPVDSPAPSVAQRPTPTETLSAALLSAFSKGKSAGTPPASPVRSAGIPLASPGSPLPATGSQLLQYTAQASPNFGKTLTLHDARQLLESGGLMSLQGSEIRANREVIKNPADGEITTDEVQKFQMRGVKVYVADKLVDLRWDLLSVFA
ncbi:MAG: hypothetical protein LBC42_01570 [Puniceicoccales bacterium]|nr:hypothetical protein [Puniceicoccales bacterium]